VSLQRAEPRDGVVDRACCGVRIRQRRQAGGERTFVVLGDDLVDEATYGGAVLDGVETAPADELAYLGLDRVHRAHVRTVIQGRRSLPDVWTTA
jgi:hypothetical protein